MRGEPPPPRKRPRTQPVTGNRPPSAPRNSRSRPSSLNDSSRPRTLVDLLGGNSSRAEQLLGDDAPGDAWSAMANTIDNLPSESRHHSGVVQPRLTSEQDDPNPASDIQEQPREQLLLDLSIKSSLNIVSSNSLWWTKVRGQGDEYGAFRDLLGCDQLSEHRTEFKQPFLPKSLSTQQIALSQAKRNFYAALLHFRCPCASLPPVISRRWQLVFNPTTETRMDSATQEASNVAMERLQLWQSAFQSLFSGYKQGHIDHFYVILPSTAVLFNHHVNQNDSSDAQANHKRRGSSKEASIESERVLRVYFAKGSPGLRALLADYVVPYSLVQDSEESSGTSAVEEPCIVAEGALAAQAVYNFLFSVGHKISNAIDVPTLLCDKPFRGGTGLALQLSRVDEAKALDSETGESTVRYSAEIKGLLTPRQVRIICTALVETQSSDFSVRMETETSSSTLNACGQSTNNDHRDRQGERRSVASHSIRGRRVLSLVKMTANSPKFLIYTRPV